MSIYAPTFSLIAPTEALAVSREDESRIVDISWRNPTDPRWDHTEVYRSVGTFLNSPVDPRGVLVFSGTTGGSGGTHAIADTAQPGKEYAYYTLFGIRTDLVKSLLLSNTNSATNISNSEEWVSFA